MKIEIEIDIESIVIEALKKKQGVEAIQKVQASTTGRYYTAKEKATDWEFGPKSGHRRTAEERAMHKVERKHGRILTPEEKGEAKALVQIDEITENKAKEDTIKKAHIDSLTAEGMAAASKELEEEKEVAEEEHRDPDSVNGNGIMEREEDKKEATIPKTQDVGNSNSLFI